MPRDPLWTATWTTTTSSAARDAREAATLILHALTDVYRTPTDPVAIQVYETAADEPAWRDDPPSGPQPTATNLDATFAMLSSLAPVSRPGPV